MLISSLVYLLAPDACVACGRPGRAVCSSCTPSVAVYKSPVCFRCNRITTGGKTCSNCRRHTALNCVTVASYYEGPLKELLARLKYDNATDLARPLAQLVAARIRPEQVPDVIVPVPSSSQRFRQRGYNPAALLSKEVARQLQVPRVEALGRLGQSRQVGAARRQRISQLAGAYYVRRPQDVIGKRILLIDDVITTGSTLHECAGVLLRSGAKTITAAVVAKH